MIIKDTKINEITGSLLNFDMLRKHTSIFALFVTSQHRNGTDSWNPSTWVTRTHLSSRQYHGCWWPGDASRQVISSHGIDQALPEHSSFNTWSVNWHRINSFAWLINSYKSIGKTPVRIILWCPITKMVIKACFLIQPLEQEGRCQKCCISLCSKVFINHFYQMKASPECLNILTYRSRYWVDRLRRTPRRKI